MNGYDLSATLAHAGCGGFSVDILVYRIQMV